MVIPDKLPHGTFVGMLPKKTLRYIKRSVYNKGKDMPRAEICIFGGKKISVAEAIEIKEGTKKRHIKDLNFTCTYCGNAVRPHKAGGLMSAHFEHLIRNPMCILSDPQR